MRIIRFVSGNKKRVPASQDSVVKVAYIRFQGYQVNIHCHAYSVNAQTKKRFLAYKRILKVHGYFLNLIER